MNGILVLRLICSDYLHIIVSNTNTNNLYALEIFKNLFIGGNQLKKINDKMWARSLGDVCLDSRRRISKGFIDYPT